MAEKQLSPCSLFSASVDGKTLDNAIAAFFAVAQDAALETFAIFYAPHKCFLAKHNGQDFEVKEAQLDLNRVFEARIFNGVAEMRWLNGTKGDHATAILSEKQFAFAGLTLQADPRVIGGLPQEYLLWGQPVEGPKNGWTKFGTSRIGAFFVPIETNEPYARFQALEYLKIYEDGNVAVVDERLTGIEGYEGETHNG